jgi:general secretion pathway protein L
MAHDTIGLDLGSSFVRAVVVRISLRQREIVRLEQEPVPLDETGCSTPAAIVEAAGRLLKRLALEGETIHCAIPGESASVRKIILPISAVRRLDQVLKFELDEVLPYDIEDAVFDYVETERTNEEIALLTATAPRDQIVELIDGLAAQEIAPREIGVSSFSYLNRIFTGHDTEAVSAFIDIGHTRTNIAVLDRTEPTIRTILRGGRQLTQKLSEAGGVEFHRAEAYKKEYGLTGRVGEVLRKSLKPFVREIQQTFKGHLAAGGRPVSDVKLCGGGSLLVGLESYLSEALGVPVEVFQLPARSEVKDTNDLRGATYTLAYTLALREEVPRSKRIDVRRGGLAFKGNLDFLKNRVRWLAVSAAAIVLSWVVSGFAEYSSISGRVEQQRAELEKRTSEVFGKPIADHDRIEEMLEGTKKDEEEAPVPDKDAFDVLVELSKRIPVSVVHDVEQLEIKPMKVILKGMVDADLKSESEMDSEGTDDKPDAPETGGESPDLAPTDLIKQKLEEYTECFTAVRVGRVSTVDERRRYQMDIDSRCP